jgi:hypothetical protein
MLRRSIVLGLLAAPCLPSASRATSDWTLLTPDDVARSLAAPHNPRLTRALQIGAPAIEIVEPDEIKPIASPITIRLSFTAFGGAAIDVTRFRATYGWLELDITERLLRHAQLTAAGLTADHAEIPPGHHSVTLTIADTMHRSTSRTFEFTVA